MPSNLWNFMNLIPLI
uniref:Uncharacterized protein n=1 Tax=Rhizophora mucronata TaxID=61149 RepID=A0A2P2KB93_RHIMU